MKVDAYRCDYCGSLVESDEIVGINPVADMFDKLLSYPSVKNPARTSVHHCLDCSRDQCITKAENEAPRKKNERLYQLKFQELYYMLRSQCVENVKVGKKFVRIEK